jgi:hypothetical protein
VIDRFVQSENDQEIDHDAESSADERDSHKSFRFADRLASFVTEHVEGLLDQ